MTTLTNGARQACAPSAIAFDRDDRLPTEIARQSLLPVRFLSR